MKQQMECLCIAKIISTIKKFYSQGNKRYQTKFPNTILKNQSCNNVFVTVVMVHINMLYTDKI